ncbi:cadherin 24, type 2b, partial [Amia ocellicauda]|uniref:cadherin 24, type 2b n=1 Tax=Amia ocellicauda TaxID=2972642 RepID=UPI0034647256
REKERVKEIERDGKGGRRRGNRLRPEGTIPTVAAQGNGVTPDSLVTNTEANASRSASSGHRAAPHRAEVAVGSGLRQTQAEPSAGQQGGSTATLQSRTIHPEGGRGGGEGVTVRPDPHPYRRVPTTLGRTGLTLDFPVSVQTDSFENLAPGPDGAVHTVPGNRSAVIPDSGDSQVQFDSSPGHFIRLRPQPLPKLPAQTLAHQHSTGVTLESRPGGGPGLLFQEAEPISVGGRGPSRSRNRRSWIWNQFFVIEEYTGPEPVLIGRLHTDMDRGDGRTRYVLGGEGAGSVFVIDERSGNIHLTKPLDREEKGEYRLVATATDRQTGRALEPASTFVVRVQDINDNAPVFPDGPYSATVPEMANIGTSIIQVTATDADDPAYGNSARLVYTLLQGQPYFSVDPQTGVVRTAVPSMDRETQDRYLLVLQAKDMGGHLGGLSGTTTVTVSLSDVNDNPPRFTQSVWSFSVSELARPGAEIGRLSATDADIGDNARLEYVIAEGEGGGPFNITGLNQEEAVITLTRELDYESRSSYSFWVEVLNSWVDPLYLRRGPFKDRASVRVLVLDAPEPPRFSRARYRLALPENTPPPASPGRVSATDPDSARPSRIRYSIDPQSDPEILFRIDADSGVITTAAELDREAEEWHNITVIATERDSPSQMSRVLVAIETLDVNDNPPELETEYSTALCDSAQPGEVVQMLRAVDRDSGWNGSQVQFSIAAESSMALNFSVRETGGAMATLVLLSPLSSLPPSQSLRVPVVLRDKGTPELATTGTVTVSVCPCIGGVGRGRGRSRGGQLDGQTACLPLPSSSPSAGLSTAALLAILACIATLLAVCALSVSLRGQKRDGLSGGEEEDVRENIISYDDEGGGEEDTAAFDMAALQHPPRPHAHAGPHTNTHPHTGWYRTVDGRYPQHSQTLKQSPALWARPGSVYGRFLPYSSHTLPAPRLARGPPPPGHLYPLQMDSCLVFQNPSGAEPVRACNDGGPEPQGKVTDQNQPHGTAAAGKAEWDWNHDQSQSRARASEPGQNWNQNYSQVQSGSSPSRSQSGTSQPSTSAAPPPPPPPPPPHPDLLSGGDPSATLPSRPPPWHPNPALLLLSSSSSSSSPLPPRPCHGPFPEPEWGGVGEVAVTTAVGCCGAGGGGISLTGTPCLFPEGTTFLADWREALDRGYGWGRRDILPQLLPHPGQSRTATLGPQGAVAWGWDRGGGGRDAEREGGVSLSFRVGEFLRLRLAQVTADPSQPPYDSVQIYGFEGQGSRAGSLSSLGSEGEQEGEREGGERGGGEGGELEDWGHKFQRLVELLTGMEGERERKREGEGEGEAERKGEGVAEGEREGRGQTEREKEKEGEAEGDQGKGGEDGEEKEVRTAEEKKEKE